MDPDKRVKLSKDIGEKVRERMSELGLRNYDLIVILSNQGNLSVNTAGQLSEIRSGKYLLQGLAGRSKSYNNKLKRLSTLLFSLNFGEDDLLIADIKSNYPIFEYPPKMQEVSEEDIDREIEQNLIQLKADDKYYINSIIKSRIVRYRNKI